eukprot:TRINITY_DN11875_c0_g1_i2.p1 TRINITY_DN11875_c0_g1~~TRINITY_DN11875_c0_g1_i2.p1  ORF type:complete len:778 (+),score=122.43 TRINITY_DN11875_c0_g1_i2:143-2476(+)
MTQIDKHVSRSLKSQLSAFLDKKIYVIKNVVDQDEIWPRDQLAKFVWDTAKQVWKIIQPDSSSSRKQDWEDGKGMLKDIVNWNQWHPSNFLDTAVHEVLEKQVFEVLARYKHFVETGVVNTTHQVPKLLGETDELLCVDKPCLFTCSYGSGTGDKTPPRIAQVESATQLLNLDRDRSPQIHQYLALKFNYENAVATREWWKTKPKEMKDTCGRCADCAATQAGCCNRLDKETSGVMIAAKTAKGFTDVRLQFASTHSREEGGTEKYYLALVHGEVELPKAQTQHSPDWLHEPITDLLGERGRIEIACFVTRVAGVNKAIPWNDGKGDASKGAGKGQGKQKNKAPDADDDGWDGDENEMNDAQGRQSALTLYRPIAWFYRAATKQKYTLLHLQIITGRFHQIRFHCGQIGHPLVGDPTYGAPWEERDWARRVFLHSYQTKFREPFTNKWFEVTSPLPEDLGTFLDKELVLERTLDSNKPFFKTRRPHAGLKKICEQYDPSKPLMVSEAAPINGEDILQRANAANARHLQAQSLKDRKNNSLKDWQNNSSSNSCGPDKTGNLGSKDPSWSKDGQWSNNSTGWNPKADWNTDSSRDGNSWNKPGWKDNSWNGKQWSSGGSPAKEPPAPSQKAGSVPAAVDEDDDDEDWGGWKAPKEEDAAVASSGSAPAVSSSAPASEGSPAKRARHDAPQGVQSAGNAGGMMPQTPPDLPDVPDVPKSGWKRMESRSQPGVFYYFNESTGQTSVEPPPPWEVKASRSAPGVFYYWNSSTGQTSVEKPQV